MNESRPLATLEPVRFGEFLRDRKLINEEQWLAALADHWSAPRHRRIGATIVERGLLSADQVEAEARAFHDDLHVIEVEEAEPVEEADVEAEVAAAEETTGEVVPPQEPSEIITSPVPRVDLG